MRERKNRETPILIQIQSINVNKKTVSKVCNLACVSNSIKFSIKTLKHTFNTHTHTVLKDV